VLEWLAQADSEDMDEDFERAVMEKLRKQPKGEWVMVLCLHLK
jgi:hypothetical protein